MQIGPTLGSKVYKWYLLWAIWSLREKASAQAAQGKQESALSESESLRVEEKLHEVAGLTLRFRVLAFGF